LSSAQEPWSQGEIIDVIERGEFTVASIYAQIRSTQLISHPLFHEIFFLLKDSSMARIRKKQRQRIRCLRQPQRTTRKKSRTFCPFGNRQQYRRMNTNSNGAPGTEGMRNASRSTISPAIASPTGILNGSVAQDSDHMFAV
jgi:hypothetical protein